MTVLRLTYAELAVRLGRSADAARVLARRRGWQRVTGNDGRVVVLVDEGELGPDSPTERPAEQPDTDRLRDELETALRQFADLREALAEARAEAKSAHDIADARVDAAKAEAKAVREMADWLMDELAEARRPWWRRLYR